MYPKVAALSVEITEQFIINDVINYLEGFNEEVANQLDSIIDHLQKVGFAKIAVNDALLKKYELYNDFIASDMDKNMLNVFSCLLKKEIVKYFAVAIRKELNEIEIAFNTKHGFSANINTVRDITKCKENLAKHKMKIVVVNKAIIKVLEDRFYLDETAIEQFKLQLNHMETKFLDIIYDIARKFISDKTDRTITEQKRAANVVIMKNKISDIFNALRTQLLLVS